MGLNPIQLQSILRGAPFPRPRFGDSVLMDPASSTTGAGDQFQRSSGVLRNPKELSLEKQSRLYHLLQNATGTMAVITPGRGDLLNVFLADKDKQTITFYQCSLGPSEQRNANLKHLAEVLPKNVVLVETSRAQQNATWESLYEGLSAQGVKPQSLHLSDYFHEASSVGGVILPSEDAMALNQALDRAVRVRMSDIAHQLSPIFQAQHDATYKTIRDIINESGLQSNIEIQSRIKTPETIFMKLYHKAILSRGQVVPDLEAAMKIIHDGNGARLVLNAPDQMMGPVIEQFAQAIRDKRIQLVSLRNFHGPGVQPYLSDAQISILQSAERQAFGRDPEMVTDKIDPKWTTTESGYTSVHLQLKVDGHPIELQIRGTLTHAVSERDRLLYAMLQGKEYCHGIGHSKVQQEYHRLQSTYNWLTPQEKSVYQAYLNQHYVRARELEGRGEHVSCCRDSDAVLKCFHDIEFPPELSEKYAPILSFQSLNQLYQDIQAEKEASHPRFGSPAHASANPFKHLVLAS